MSPHHIDKDDLVAMANVLRIVSHPSRLSIAMLLLNGPCAVSEIELSLGLRQPNLSQHLGVLRDAQVLTAYRHAKSVIYEVAEGMPTALIGALRQCAPDASATTGPGPAPMPASAIRSPPAPEPHAMSGETDDGLMFAQVLQRPRKAS